eukprot:5657173-Alexandrium_andersonii.AAC.1
MLRHRFTEGNEGRIVLQLFVGMLRHHVDSQGQRSSGMILAVAGRGSTTVNRPAKVRMLWLKR